MSKRKIPATDNRQYTKFISQRDRALEKLLWVHQRRLSEITRSAMANVLQSLVPLYGQKHLSRSLVEHLIMEHIRRAKIEAWDVLITARRQAFLLSGVSQAEALARMKGSGTYNFTAKDDHDNRTVCWQLTDHFFHQLGAKIADRAFHSLSFTKDTKDQFIAKVLSAMPKVRRARTPEQLLPKIREAGGKSLPINLATGYVDDREWDKLVDDYLTTEIPRYRGPEDVIDQRTLPKSMRDPDDQILGWQLEQQLTEQFVTGVVQGDTEGAKQNGTEDFVWVAVLDSKTCEECCEWRHGMLLSEISKEADDDEGCDALYPPLHPNCRCRIVPAVPEALEETKSNAEDFATWLNTA